MFNISPLFLKLVLRLFKTLLFADIMQTHLDTSTKTVTKTIVNPAIGTVRCNAKDWEGDRRNITARNDYFYKLYIILKITLVSAL